MPEIPKSALIHYLVNRRFPNYVKVAAARAMKESSRKSSADSAQISSSSDDEASAFRREIEAKPLEEIKALYEQEEEREERERFFNQPKAQADFTHWAKMTYWTLDEAIALASGKEPKVVHWDMVKRDVGVSPFANEYAKVRELVQRAKNWKQLDDPVLPSAFLAWARRMEIEVPPELMAQVEARGIVIASVATAPDSKPIAKRKAPDAFIAALIRLLTEISKRAAEKGTPFDVTAMPGTKSDFMALAEKFDGELEKAPRTFDDYLAGLVQFRQGVRETAFYQELFPEFFRSRGPDA